MKNLQLLLKKPWFEMTKSGVKTEDYREITPYWANRLFKKTTKSNSLDYWKGYLGQHGKDGERSFYFYGFKNRESIDYILKTHEFKEFSSNIMTLGYPKSTDISRIIKLEHRGIEIREGNHEWGAEKGKLYFVIIHGGRC